MLDKESLSRACHPNKASWGCWTTADGCFLQLSLPLNVSPRHILVCIFSTVLDLPCLSTARQMRSHSFIHSFRHSLNKLHFCVWHCAGHRNTKTLPSRKTNTEMNKRLKRPGVSDRDCTGYKEAQREGSSPRGGKASASPLNKTWECEQNFEEEQELASWGGRRKRMCTPEGRDRLSRPVQALKSRACGEALNERGWGQGSWTLGRKQGRRDLGAPPLVLIRGMTRSHSVL